MLKKFILAFMLMLALSAPAFATISSTNSRMDYTGNGAVDTYSYNFRIFSNTDLLVTVRDTDDVETTLTLTTDYTVTGVGGSGGNVVLVNSAQDWLDGDGDLKSNYILTIRRVRPLKQLTDIRNQGAFYPETHENAFDHFIMIDQQQQDEIDRSLKLPETIDPADFDTSLPVDMGSNPGASVIVNDDGDGFVVGPTADAISGAQASASAAASSASAASTSASSAATSAATAQAAASSIINFWGGTVGGTADAITLTPSPALGAYAAGVTYTFLATGTNTTAVTVAVSGLTAKSIKTQSGAALTAGNITSGRTYTMTYDGTNFIVKELATPEDGVVTTAKLASSAVTNAKVDASAAIAYSKLNLSASITRTDIASGYGLVPTGAILMWSGTIATIPTGWVLCNGSNSTPDLRNLFIVAADADSGGVAKSTITGSALQTHATGLVLDHTHSYQTTTTPGAGDSGGAIDTYVTSTTGSVNSGNSSSKNIAPFYALAFIMKT